jgi:Fe-Mn family superoxide dismutase
MTMEIHHQKHHGGYTSKLNAALEGHPKFHRYSAEQLLRGWRSLPESIRAAVRDNGGGYHNHRLFWEVMAPGGSTAPSEELAGALEAAFGSFESFKDRFSSTAAARFGSGWGWLAVGAFGQLHVFSTPNQDSPLLDGYTPVLGVDVWEHAYYLNYQNRRPDYLNAFWHVVNWEAVAEKYDAAKDGWVGSVHR